MLWWVGKGRTRCPEEEGVLMIELDRERRYPVAAAGGGGDEAGERDVVGWGQSSLQPSSRLG